MPESSNQVIQHAREVRRKQIRKCSEKAAHKIMAIISWGSKLPMKEMTKDLADLIAESFEEMVQ
jgi:hypothetical protein